MTGRLRRPRLLLLSLALLPLSATAEAAEICISCVGPDVTYRCSVDGYDNASARDTRLQLICITELAKAGGHQTCSADRSKLADCDGVVRVVTPPQPAAGTEPPPIRAETTPPPAEGMTTIPKNSGLEPTPAPPPATVADVAKDAAQSSKENLDKVGKAVTDTAKSAGDQIENAGQAVGSAAKKTWDCVASLFKEC